MKRIALVLAGICALVAGLAVPASAWSGDTSVSGTCKSGVYTWTVHVNTPGDYHGNPVVTVDASPPPSVGTVLHDGDTFTTTKNTVSFSVNYPGANGDVTSYSVTGGTETCTAPTTTSTLPPTTTTHPTTTTTIPPTTTSTTVAPTTTTLPPTTTTAAPTTTTTAPQCGGVVEDVAEQPPCPTTTTTEVPTTTTQPVATTTTEPPVVTTTVPPVVTTTPTTEVSPTTIVVVTTLPPERCGDVKACPTSTTAPRGTSTTAVPPTTGHVTPIPGSPLPFTGSNSGLPVLIGLGFLIGGGALLFKGRHPAR